MNLIAALAGSLVDNDFGRLEKQHGLQTVTRMAGLLTRHYKRKISTWQISSVLVSLQLENLTRLSQVMYI